jgi:hypothetical protein
MRALQADDPSIMAGNPIPAQSTLDSDAGRLKGLGKPLSVVLFLALG